MSGFRRIAALICSFALLLSSACSVGKTEGRAPSEKVRLYVLAAASLTDAVREIQARYEADHPGVRLVPTFASSGRLKQQIERGAPADLFLSAGTLEMEELVAKNRIDPRFHAELLENELVLIAPEGASLKGLTDMASNRAKRIAIGHPETVPAGTYAREALAHFGLWEKLQRKLVFAGDVRQVLAYVKTGNADAGIVYRTDSRHGGVSVIAEIPPESHRRIVYPLGVVKGTKHPSEARALYRWLQGEEARSVFEKYGFKGVAAPPSK
jgi:molybdate transport system substrate-binding protein